MKRAVSWIAAYAIFFAVGCGGSGGGVQRHDLHGKVTYQGSPVPAGRITFRPDRSKGGAGPSGFGEILDGEYSTGDSGRGAVSGPVKVVIEGAVSKQPMSQSLFPAYSTEIEVNGEQLNYDFDVP